MEGIGKNRKAIMIGIIGFGRFGRFMARHLMEDFKIYIYDEIDSADSIRSLGAIPVDLPEVCKQDVVILAVPISKMKLLLEQMAPHLKEDALVIDVCSVKTYPVQWMERILPHFTSILACHPMFGPDSAADSLVGHKIFLCPVRLKTPDYRKIKAYLEAKGLVLIESTPEAHDREVAFSLSLTHFIGRSLSACGAKPLQMDTEGYKRLLHILNVVQNDTWELFYDMHRYNPFAGKIRMAFVNAMQEIAKELEA